MAHMLSFPIEGGSARLGPTTRIPLDLLRRELERHYGARHVIEDAGAIVVRGQLVGGKLEPLPDDLRPVPAATASPLAS